MPDPQPAEPDAPSEAAAVLGPAPPEQARPDATPEGPARHQVFLHLLANTLVASVVNFTVWFAVTFWVYLETRSVFATGVIAGIYLVFTTVSGVWFGGLVDRTGIPNARSCWAPASPRCCATARPWRCIC